MLAMLLDSTETLCILDSSVLGLHSSVLMQMTSGKARGIGYDAVSVLLGEKSGHPRRDLLGW